MLAKKTPALGAFSDLHEVKTSAELNISLKRLQNELISAQDRKTALKEELDAALFNKGDVAAVRKLQNENSDAIATLEAAIEGVNNRIVDALKLEDEADQSAAAQVVLTAADELKMDYQRRNQAFAALIEICADCDRSEQKLEKANSYFPDIRSPFKRSVRTVRTESLTPISLPGSGLPGDQSVVGIKMFQHLTKLASSLDVLSVIDAGSTRRPQIGNVNLHPQPRE